MARQLMLRLESDNEDISRAFKFAMLDIWSNINPYKDGTIDGEEVLTAGFDYDDPWTRDTAINIMNGAGFMYPEILKNNLFSALLEDNQEYYLRDSTEEIKTSGNYWDSVI